MNKITLIINLFVFACMSVVSHAQKTDTLTTSKGNLIIHFLGHGSLMFESGSKNIQVDPFSKVADYSKLPKADLILVTHHHSDHFDMEAINAVYKNGTKIICTEMCKQSGKLDKAADIMHNGDNTVWDNIKIEAVAAYNIQHKRPDGNPFHPKGEGNGYILSFGDKNVYIAGDTENIPEMKNLGKIDVAFLPMNLPYTMTPEMTADAAKMIKPAILYPYHFGDTDTSKIISLLTGEKEIEVRLRDMK